MVHANTRWTAADAYDRVDHTLEGGLKDKPPDELFNAEPIESDDSLDELFESNSNATQENSSNDYTKQ